MFIELKTGAMLNLFWLQDCFQGKHDKNIVIFYMVNGSKLVEEYATDSEAEQRVEDVHEIMKEAGGGGGGGSSKSIIRVVDELPTEDIDENVIYLVPAPSSETGNLFTEYIYVNNAWEVCGNKTVDIEEIDDRLDSLEETVTWKEYL